MFEYALKKGHVGLNPVSKIARPAINKADPIILGPKSIERFLRAAEELYPELVPRLALSFFCGIRPKELDRLLWSSISLENRCVTVGSAEAKMSQRRVTTMSENAVAWLAAYWPANAESALRSKDAKAIKGAISANMTGKRKEKAEGICDLYMSGLTMGQISEELGVSKGSVSGYLNEIEQLSGETLIIRELDKRSTQKITPVSQSTWRKWIKEVCDKSKVELPSNAGRHAFASYHLALNESSDQTAKQMGHSNAKLVHSHYRNVVTADGKSITQKLAGEFWKIRPRERGNVIRMPA